MDNREGQEKNTPPKKIYLQWCGADKDDLTPEELAIQPGRGDVTWCSDKQFDTDVEYVRSVAGGEPPWSCNGCNRSACAAEIKSGQETCVCGGDLIESKLVAGGEPEQRLEVQRETDGRWIAEWMHVPGCIAYGENRLSAVTKATVLLEKIGTK